MSRAASLKEVRSLPGMEARVAALDWDRLHDELDADGACVVRGLLSEAECDETAALYADESFYRSKVIMARHGYGQGEYKYFRYPLPPLVAELRTHVWPKLAPVANRWNDAMRIDVRYPGSHAEFVRRCHDAGQVRPTALMLNYTA